MYAIVNISGKQFKASEGMKVRVPKQTGEQGSSITFNEVLLLNDGTNTQLGNPILSGATVTATILDQFISRTRKRYTIQYWFTKRKDGKVIKGKTDTVNGTQT